MKKFWFCLLLFMLLSGAVSAQECGPNCPVCSGAGSGGGALLSQKSITLSGLSIPTADEETVVLNARVGILSWLDAGIGYAVDTEKILWNLRTQPILEQENGWRPGVILGTGSVQAGGSDQSGYVQLTKSFELSEVFGLQFMAGGATLLPDFDEFYGLAGITASLLDRYAAFASYDGESLHEGVSWIPLDWLTLSFLLVETELPAFAITIMR